MYRRKKNSDDITLSDFTFSYGRSSEVLNIQQVKIPRGAAIAVIGQNGAGKSTFARCLCGLEKKCLGVAHLNGQSLSRKLRLKACYMVMQDVNHQLFTESVLDEVLISMEQENEEQAENILSGLDLLQFRDIHPMSLSGGQKQRVAIASAVASERKIIVFDEPTSGLDLRHMHEVAQNLRQLARMGKSLLVITHDPEFILSCCTHMLQIENGQIVRNQPLDTYGIEQMLGYFNEMSKEKYEKRVV
ncbi:MAG: transporter related [Eubacterium sp.]|nr:transporter related [Eubacterium sp.]